MTIDIDDKRERYILSIISLFDKITRRMLRISNIQLLLSYSKLLLHYQGERLEPLIPLSRSFGFSITNHNTSTIIRRLRSSLTNLSTLYCHTDLCRQKSMYELSTVSSALLNFTWEIANLALDFPVDKLIHISNIIFRKFSLD